MKEEFKELRGKEDGPTSIILAGVHGDERCGTEAFEKLLPDLQIERGRVLFVYGNLLAIRENKRFVEADLNRMFKDGNLLLKSEKGSYEYKRAQFLKKYLDQAEVLLDIHASSNPKSEKFLICEPNSAEIIKYLPFNLVVSGFDEVEPGGTDYYMNMSGKIGICAECGYARDSLSTQVALECILSFLAARNHISGKKVLHLQSHIKMYQLYLAKTNDFNLSKTFSDFEKVTKGEVIGTDGEKKVRTLKDSIILFASGINEIGGEAFLLGEYKGPAQ